MPHTGWRHSDEARARMTAARTGRRHTPETKAKISASNIGKHSREISAAQRAAVSAALKGVPFTVDHCDKISDAHIAYHERVNPPASAAARHKRERWRTYKRALRARRRAAKS
jgi:hypothetical protein